VALLPLDLMQQRHSTAVTTGFLFEATTRLAFTVSLGGPLMIGCALISRLAILIQYLGLVRRLLETGLFLTAFSSPVFFGLVGLRAMMR